MKLAYYLQSSVVDLSRSHFSSYALEEKSGQRLFESGMSSYSTGTPIIFVDMMYLAVSQLGLYMHVLPSLGHKLKSKSAAEFKQPASNIFFEPLQGAVR